MKMKKNLFYKVLGLLAWVSLGWGCSENIQNQDHTDGILLELRVSSGLMPASRTVLPGSNPVQHVTRISLYLFQHSSPEDTLGARLVHSMTFDDVAWNQNLDGAIGDGNGTMIQRVTVPQEWFSDVPGNTCFTFLAIGTDETFTKSSEVPSLLQWNKDNSTRTYGLDRLDLNGKTLAECYAELQSGIEVGSIHESELFAGTKTVFASNVWVNTVIPLDRRVAGVKGFFCRIPQKIKEKEVETVRVVYWNPQLTSVPFYKRSMKNGIFQDYDQRGLGDDATASEVSAIPEVNEKIDPAVLEQCTYFVIPKDSFPKTDKITDISTAASYVLPAPGAVGENNATLYVLLMAADGTVLDKKRVFFKSSIETQRRVRGTTDQGTGIIEGQPGNREELDRQRRYPIIANNYYTIGTAGEPIDLSTGETDVFLYVDPSWEGSHSWGNIIPAS